MAGINREAQARDDRSTDDPHEGKHKLIILSTESNYNIVVALYNKHLELLVHNI